MDWKTGVSCICQFPRTLILEVTLNILPTRHTCNTPRKSKPRKSRLRARGCHSFSSKGILLETACFKGYLSACFKGYSLIVTFL
jgi:hypothetical protein